MLHRLSETQIGGEAVFGEVFCWRTDDSTQQDDIQPHRLPLAGSDITHEIPEAAFVHLAQARRDGLDAPRLADILERHGFAFHSAPGEEPAQYLARALAGERHVVAVHEDEFFLVLSGEIRVQHAEEVVEAVAGSFVYTPRGIGHSFHVDSDNARLLLFFGPAGVEGFFREVATPARSFSLPPADEPVPDRATLVEIMRRHGQTVLGPPLPPKGQSVNRHVIP